jgi:hypothetical protein
VRLLALSKIPDYAALHPGYNFASRDLVAGAVCIVMLGLFATMPLFVAGCHGGSTNS